MPHDMRIAMRMRSVVHGSAGLEESSVLGALTSSKTLMAYSPTTCPCLSLRRICSGSGCRHLKPTSALNSPHVRRAACSGTGRVILRYSWRAGREDRREIEGEPSVSRFDTLKVALLELGFLTNRSHHILFFHNVTARAVDTI